MPIDPQQELAAAFDPVAILHDVAHLTDHINRHLTNLRGELSNSQLERFGRVEALMGRLTLLCQTGLIGARMVHGRHSLKKLSLPLGPLLNEALETVRPLAAHRNLSLRLETEHRPNVILADPAHFPRVLENLLLNAIEVSPNGGEVTVRTESAKGFVTLTISDEGPGFSGSPPEETPAGFGLAVVRALVSLHAGELNFVPRSPRGTATSIRLALGGEVKS